jgi:hypothetical protein
MGQLTRLMNEQRDVSTPAKLAWDGLAPVLVKLEPISSEVKACRADGVSIARIVSKQNFF